MIKAGESYEKQPDTGQLALLSKKTDQRQIKGDRNGKYRAGAAFLSEQVKSSTDPVQGGLLRSASAQTGILDGYAVQAV